MPVFEVYAIASVASEPIDARTENSLIIGRVTGQEDIAVFWKGEPIEDAFLVGPVRKDPDHPYLIASFGVGKGGVVVDGRDMPNLLFRGEMLHVLGGDFAIPYDTVSARPKMPS